MLLQAHEGPAMDVDTVIGVLMAEDLSPAALAALKADALGLSFRPPPQKKQAKAGKRPVSPRTLPPYKFPHM